jgi:uncharacterized membrane protein YkoI
MKKTLSFVLLAGVVAGGVFAQGGADKEQAELAKALPSAKVPLETGVSAASTAGKAISAKYEVEDGKLQLSVYTEKDGKFSEVIVDHNTGKVAKSEPITEGEDLAAAKPQGEAMAKAKLSLDAAVTKALATNAGFRAVSVTPSLKDGHPVANVTLVKGTAWKTTAIKLD